MESADRPLLYETIIEAPPGTPAGIGIDAGLTLTKVARSTDGRLHLSAALTARERLLQPGQPGLVGVTGARTSNIDAPSAAVAQEIEAAARGVRALAPRTSDFCLILLGTGTAFAAIRGETVTHLGGAAIGGGSFASIARAIYPNLTYGAMITAAGRGDRRKADLMISDAYPEGIGRLNAELTAAHLSRTGASLDDYLAGLLNMHGESIAQIGAQRARLQQLDEIVLCGGFAHENPRLVESITFMCGLFGVKCDVCPQPGFAGAVGALLLAAATNS